MVSQIDKDALILNVDDNDGARYAKTRILQRAGYQVCEAASGSEALAKAREAHPDLVLLDVKLPDINGMEVCRQLKKEETTQTILVLQTSASYIATADKVKALDGGADNYLVEPIEPEELLANVKALLRLGKVERQLRESDRRKDEFIATLAHELRNPLGPIRSSVELLRKLDPVVPPLQEKAREVISRHTLHLTRLVDDLLDVSRVTQGKISLKIERVALKDVLDSALESSAQAIENRRHTLSVEMPDQDLAVEGDPVRLVQIITNLAHNAAKFTPEGGRIQLSITAENNCACIRVTDNGIGIPVHNLDTIFELFSQSGATTGQFHDGLGIGLALVRALVQMHGGKVTARSPGSGQGSTFEVTLPLAAAQQASAQDTAGAASEPAGPRRILIVDDNTDAADILAQLLQLSGHQVATAYTGKDAIARTQAFAPDTVFLDIGLPDISGYQVATELRKLPDLPRFLLVALTGYGQSHDREAALRAGFDEHITKPLDLDKLKALGLSI